MSELDVQKIVESIVRGDAAAVDQLTRRALETGTPPELILEKGLISGMTVIGVTFKNSEIFVPEVLVAARAMRAGMALLEPILIAHGIKPVGRFVIGTVKGDIHDIGKNLVAMMLKGAGFDVIDLGINIPPDRFLEAIEEHGPQIVGMSALLTTTMIQMKYAIETIRRPYSGGRVKIMVGGAPVTEAFAREIGADGYAKDAAEAAEKALELLAGAKKE